MYARVDAALGVNGRAFPDALQMVVDYETVARAFPEGAGETEVIRIYEADVGKIIKDWFKPAHINRGEKKRTSVRKSLI